MNEEVIFMRLPLVFRYPILDGYKAINASEEVKESIIRKIENDEEFTEEEELVIDDLPDLEYLSSLGEAELTDLDREIIELATKMIPGYKDQREEYFENESYYCKFFVITFSNGELIKLDSTESTIDEPIDDILRSKEELESTYVYLHEFFLDNDNTEKVFQIYSKKVNSDLDDTYPEEMILLNRLDNMFLAVNLIEGNNGNIDYDEFFVIDENTLHSNYDYERTIEEFKSSKELYFEIVDFINQKMIENSNDNPHMEY